MKNKILYIFLAISVMLSSCNDFLDVKNDSIFGDDFVFQDESEAYKAIIGAYEVFRASNIGATLRYDMLAVGSDAEFHPEPFKYSDRQEMLHGFPSPITLNVTPSSIFENIFAVIQRVNEIIKIFEANEEYMADVDAKKTTAWTQMYGELMTLRAIMYYELTRCWGDVPYLRTPVEGKADYEELTITDRDIIQEDMINDLKRVAEAMYETPPQGYERLSKGAAYAMIGRLGVIRGGWSIRPNGFEGNGEKDFTGNSEYGFMYRPADWKTYYEIAQEYLLKLQGLFTMVTVDPRSGSGTEQYDNPFQYIFQQQMNLEVTSESIYEPAEQKNVQSEFPYAYGRFSTSSQNTGAHYPTKIFGSIRFLPQFYYEMYHNKDKRRDVTITGIGTSLTGGEAIATFTTGGGLRNGGFCINKWDYCRMPDPTVCQGYGRKVGINVLYIRYTDMLLLLAETYATLGDLAPAKEILKTVRARAFDTQYHDEVITDYLAQFTSQEEVLEAVLDERMMELGGEAQRRYDLIRHNLLAKKIVEARTKWNKIVSDLRSKGYYEFENGNQITDYIWVKRFRTTSGTEGTGEGAYDYYTYPSSFTNTLTSSPTAVSDAEYAAVAAAVYAGTATAEQIEIFDLYGLLNPGWRGNAPEDVWGGTAVNENYAIQGFFHKLSPAEISAVEALGYTKYPWGQYYVEDFQWSDFFHGYTDADYNNKVVLRYLTMFPTATINASKGKVWSSYGYPNP